MKKCRLLLPLVAVAILLAPAAVFAQAQLGEALNFSVISWGAGWQSNFDSNSIDGGFTVIQGPTGLEGNNPPMLGVAFGNGLPVPGDAILEKHFPRVLGDTNVYDVQLSQWALPFDYLNDVDYISYSVDHGVTWTQVAIGPANWSAWNQPTLMITGTAHVPASDDLWVRYAVQDNEDDVYPSDVESLIAAVSANASIYTQAFMGTNFKVDSWGANWQNQFYSNSINGVWNNAFWSTLGPDFWGTAAINGVTVGDATVEQHFDRAPGDTNSYTCIAQLQGYAGHSGGDTQYVAYSVDSGATWVQSGSIVQNEDNWQNAGGVISVPASVQSLWVRWACANMEDWSQAYGVAPDSQIGNVSVRFATNIHTLGTNFAYPGVSNTWLSNWASAFSASNINGLFRLDSPSMLSIGFGTDPPSDDAQLDEIFVRAPGDTNAYYMTMIDDDKGTGANTDTHYIEVDNGTGLKRISQQTMTIDDAAHTMIQAVPIPATVNVVLVQNGVIDNGDGLSNTVGGSSSIVSLNTTFGPPPTPTLAGQTFTYEDPNHFYATNGAVWGYPYGGNEGIYNDGGFNYVEYLFARPAYDLTLLTASAIAGGQQMAMPNTIDMDYSFDGQNWTTFSSFSGNTWDFLQPNFGGTVNMGSNQNLYIRIACQTNTGANSPWLCYINYFQITFPAVSTVASLSAYKQEQDDSGAIVSGYVTHVESTKFTIESADRSSAFMVYQDSPPWNLGDEVNVTGYLQTSPLGERYIQSTSVGLIGNGTIQPLAMDMKYVGGGPSNGYNATTGAGQMGTVGGMGLNNMGMLVKTWGQIVQDPNSTGSDFYVVGPSGRQIMVVDPSGAASLTQGWSVGTVEGVVSAQALVSGQVNPLIILQTGCAKNFQGIKH